MRSPEELLESMKSVKAARLRWLSLQDKSQLIKLIESLGHFDPVNEDIKWLEEHIASRKITASEVSHGV